MNTNQNQILYGEFNYHKFEVKYPHTAEESLTLNKYNWIYHTKSESKKLYTFSLESNKLGAI